MNTGINLIKKEGDLYDLISREDKILELYHYEIDGCGALQFLFYDPKENRVTEIAPEIRKSDRVGIHVSYKPVYDVYFASTEEKEESALVTLYAYEIATGETREICSLNESKDVLTGEKRIRFYLLSKTQVLIQTEASLHDESVKRMGSILFTQALYNTETQTAIDIVEENLINNGINMITTLNDTDILIKTGFSPLEDSRLAPGSEADALIESIFITSMAKFTGDIMLKKKNFDMKLLVSTYLDRFILRPEVKDDFIVYNVVDINALESDCVFYNYVTGEKTTGKNTEIDPEDMRLAYVVANTPYVRKYLESSCEFVNMKTVENDISFYEEDFIDVCGDLFITSKRHRRGQNMRVYKYPHMDILLDERCRYIAGIRKENEYYLYVEK